jgi:quercetin dioxygenase-like cupin family protein
VPNYVLLEDLRKQIEIPKDGTLRRTIHQDEKAKVVLFGFSGGQELARHTASSPAIVEIIAGQVRFTLDGEERELASGSWVYMEANLPHAVYARTDAVMLLTLLL